jgi:hypothetical protein
MIQSNGIIDKNQGEKTDILGTFHGLYFFDPHNFEKQHSGPNVYNKFKHGNFYHNPGD